MDQQNQPETPKSSGAGIYMIGGVILICAGIGVYVFMQKPAVSEAVQDTNAAPVVRQTPDITMTQPASSTPDAASFKDGTYTAEGDYVSPNGPETISVTLSLKGGVVTDAQVAGGAQFGRSKMMQGMFIDNYKPFVIGKSITDINLTKVSGSSLTPKGFNDAVSKIEAQAQAAS